MPQLSYIDQARAFIHDAMALISAGARESRIRENFTSYLRLMFPAGTRWVDTHINQGETTVRLNRHGSDVAGFIDNCIDNIAIEYEKNLSVRSVFEEGLRQVREYCAAFANKGVDKDIIVGILSDTINWYVYKIQGTLPGDGIYTQDNISLTLVDELHVADNSVLSAEKLLLFLQKNLGKIGGRELTAEALSKDFGIDSIYTVRYVSDIIGYVNDSISKNPGYYSLIEDLWCEFVDVEFSNIHKLSTDSIRQTYSLEFYISVIAKLLAANILANKALLSGPDELAEIISGVYFENQGIFNFAEYDYFGWLSNERISQIIPTLQQIQRDLSVYDYSSIKSVDLFGALLVQLANRHHRLLLGQELTPSWLSRRLVDNVVGLLPPDELPRFVDMCCGSGSMLVATIDATKRLCAGKPAEELEAAILSCATGFDIDPLATILAKINWIVNVADVVDFSKGIYIPVYHSDSLFLSSLAKNSSDEDIIVTLYDKEVAIPKSMLGEGHDTLFDKIVNKCHDLIGLEVSKEILDTFVDNSCDFPGDETLKEKIREATFNLYQAMFSLNREGKNGLWSFVIKNSLRPSLIRANFNGIVSNTPWLAMSKIADNPYKNALCKLARQYNLLPTGSSAHHLELATIFLISSIDRYLKPGGAFGCIVPHSVLNGNHHLALRSGRFRDADIPVEADFKSLWLLDENVFKNKSIAIFGEKTPFVKKSTYPGLAVTSAETYETTFHVKTSGKRTIWTNEDRGIERVDYDHYKFSEGADIMPRLLFFFNLEREGQYCRISKIRQNSGYAYFLKDVKKAKDFAPENIFVDENLFVPVLLSHSLTPFQVTNMPLALMPVTKGANGKWAELTEIERNMLPRPVFNLFSSVYNEFARVKNGKKLFDDGLNIRNKLTSQELNVGDYIVVYGAGGTRTCAACFKLDKSLKDMVIDQTIYYYVTDSEDEALYLTGMLNSSAVSEANAAYQAEGALGRRHIHTLPSTSVPRYNPSDPFHKEMSQVTSDVIRMIGQSIGAKLLDPNRGSVSVRRSKIYKILDSTDKYKYSNEIAFRILSQQA